MTKEEAISIVGEMADKADNLLAAASLPGLPEEVHVAGMKGGLYDIAAELKRAYFVLSGENPWL